MTVFSNSGPLIALGKLGHLDLLFRLYGEVNIPTSVHQEVVVEGCQRGFPDALLAEMAVRRGQLKLVDVTPSDLPSDIASLPLDTGEKEVIFLAGRTSDSLALLDDLKAREEAGSRGLTVRGTLGVIVQAYRKELLGLDEVGAMIEGIMASDSIWIARGLCQEVVKQLRTESR